jgi:uncharacterized membrane protein
MGTLLAILSAFCASSKDLISKKVAASVDSTVSTFASFAFAMPFYFVLLLFLWSIGIEKFSYSKSFVVFVLLRSMTDIAAEWFKMNSLSKGDISLLAPFFSLSPLFVLLFSLLMTNDKVSIIGVCGVIGVVAGGFIAAGGTVSALKEKMFAEGVLIAIASSLFMGINTCFDKLAVQEASPALSAAVMTGLSGLFLLPFFWRVRGGRNEFSQNWKFFTLRGLFEILFMVIKMYALLFLPAAYVVALLKIAMLISIVAGGQFFDEKEQLQRFKGALVIFISIIAILLGG